MFNHEELQLLISGRFSYFDVRDLEQNTNYTGNYYFFRLTKLLLK